MDLSFEFEKIDGVDLIVMKPKEKMTDATYDKLKQYMEGMGGHWRERCEGFVFYTDILKRDSHNNWKEMNQFFPTPEAIARRVYNLSNLDNWSRIHSEKPIILEPSAGTGSLLHEIPNSLNCITYVVEPEEHNAKHLEMEGYTVNKCTFEEFYDTALQDGLQFTHILMNPPFSKSRDVKHTMMAYNLLKSGGRLVAIISENALYYKNSSSEQLRQWIHETNAVVEPINSMAFRESGTTVDTVIIVVNKE